MKLITKLRNNLSLPIAHALIGRRPDDQFLVSYPRSGSTWLRTILVNILVQYANSDPEIFNKIIPGVSITRVPQLRRNPSPRIVHSHTYYRSDIRRVVYSVRDGRDVLISFYHYLTTRKGRGQQFPQWFDDYCAGCYGHRWDENVVSWMGKGRQLLGDQMLVLRFEEMKSDPVSCITRVCSHLSLPSTPDIIERAIESASLEKARVIEKKRLGDTGSENASFYRGGHAGQWSDYLTDSKLDRFMELSEQAMRLAQYI
jgi:hypothetical protein